MAQYGPASGRSELVWARQWGDGYPRQGEREGSVPLSLCLCLTLSVCLSLSLSLSLAVCLCLTLAGMSSCSFASFITRPVLGGSTHIMDYIRRNRVICARQQTHAHTVKGIRTRRKRGLRVRQKGLRLQWVGPAGFGLTMLYGQSYYSLRSSLSYSLSHRRIRCHFIIFVVAVMTTGIVACGSKQIHCHVFIFTVTSSYSCSL